MKNEKQLTHDIAVCYYCINKQFNTMRKMGIPQSQWENNVIVKGYLKRIAKNEEKLKQLKGEQNNDTRKD